MSTPTPTIAVIGSLNMDFVTRTPRLPAAGETLSARSFATGFGGKGANQAVACARLAGSGGADSADVVVRTQMVGHVGDDGFGADYIKALNDEGIDTSGVKKLSGVQTGVTTIIVEEETGENRILFVANANREFGGEEEWGGLVPREAGVVVLQLEIPIEVVLHCMHVAREAGKHIIFNPAPAQLLPDFAYQDMDTLIMNETEAGILAGPEGLAKGTDEAALLVLAKKFLRWGVRDAVIITLGEKGLIYATAGGDEGHVPARKVKVVDTTAAGDTFVGGYAVQRARQTGGNLDYRRALEFATLAASKTVEKAGAMAAIPRLQDLSAATA